MIATFQSAGHIYQIDGKAVPSVTQALTLAGLDELAHVPRRFLARAAAIGTAVHQACEFLDQDDLDLDSLDPAIVGYVLGYQRFKMEHNFSIITIERRGVATDPTPGGLAYGFCLDRIGILDGKETLIDLKTATKKSASWAIQTAAYGEAVEFEGLRMAVHLTKQGGYKLIPHEEAGDFEQWHHALANAHWKLAHGAKLPS
jgi:hypothetical protein